MPYGTLYGVGVGPGDPQLMTLKAADVIRRCPVLAAPRTRNGGMVARDIAAGAVPLDGKTVIPLDFAMSHDPDERTRSHHAAADQLRPVLAAGRDVALVNLGDVSIYGSFRYIADILAPEGVPTVMVPGVTSFCAAAARLGASLTDIGSTLHIVPDAADLPEGVTRNGDPCVCMKSGRKLPRLLRQLAAHGLLHRSTLVQNCGMADERIVRDLAAAQVDSDYFSLVIIAPEGRA